MIISGGFNIYPSDLEAVLREHPGGGRRRRGRRAFGSNGARRRWPSSCARPGTHGSAEPNCCDWANQQRGQDPAPGRRCSFVDELPRSAIGKVLKRELRDRHVAEQRPA